MLSRLIAVFMLLGLASVAQADILFRGDFESARIYPQKAGKVDAFFYGSFDPNCNLATSPYSAKNDNSVVTSPVRMGNYANAQTIRFDCDYRPLNGNKLQKPRQSLKMQPHSLKMTEGKEYWLAFSFQTEKGWKSDYQRNPDNFFQLVKEKSSTAPDARNSGPAIVSLIDASGRFTLSLDDLHDSKGKALEAKTFSWPSKSGQWQDIVMNFKPCRFKSKCTGFIDVYVGNADRRKKGSHMKPALSFRGNITTADVHTAALNLYKYAWHCQDTFKVGGKTYSRENYSMCMKNTNPTRSKADRTVYFDEFMVGDGNSSISEIAPYFEKDCANGCRSSASKLEEAAPLPPVNAKVK